MLFHFLFRKKAPYSVTIQPDLDPLGLRVLRCCAFDEDSEWLGAVGGYKDTGPKTDGQADLPRTLLPILDATPAVSDEGGISFSEIDDTSKVVHSVEEVFAHEQVVLGFGTIVFVGKDPVRRERERVTNAVEYILEHASGGSLPRDGVVCGKSSFSILFHEKQVGYNEDA